eukprot:scaffold11552_cov76-Skeletonema_dohrnii-CCMP3373.AAC.4
MSEEEYNANLEEDQRARTSNVSKKAVRTANNAEIPPPKPYRTGLVKSKWKDFVRGSAEAVASLDRIQSIHDDSGSIAVPIERERIISGDSSSGDTWTNLRKGGSNVPYFMNKIAVDEDETVPSSLVYTSRTNSGFLLIGDKRDLFAVIHTYYPKELLNSYGRICKYLFDRVLAPFYAKSSDDKVPELPHEVYHALKSDQL